MNIEAHYNRLKNEKSSYLLQHKNNPVHWYAYGPEALRVAKEENKPIFLSIGYSSCHWCHVMAHESFNDPETAKILNENFVNIKVDREEHPDLDSYYQVACQLFSRTGGWPLSAFLLPDMRPFFVGTYYPKDAKGEKASFKDLLLELKKAYYENDSLVVENAEKVTEEIKNGGGPVEKVQFQGHFPPPEAVMEAIKDFRDTENGGFGNPPKFPHFAFYDYALEQMLEGMIPPEQGNHIIHSLEKMLFGGLYDHARGGIHRYSTDKTFLVPHFEKMLYDQAGLLKVLSKLGLLYQAPIVFDALYDTLEYLETEMLSDENFFFSAQDADSEGVEGLYFTFTREEFEDLLNKVDENIDKDKVCEWFQITEQGNFERNLNVISLNPKYKEELYQKDNWDLVRKVRKAIRDERKNRIPPQTDSKGVASWNFLLSASFIDVIQYCPIDAIKQKASTLFNKSLEGIYKAFLVQQDRPTPDGPEYLRIRHATTKEESLPYFEDYVGFMELQLRVWEICGNQVFKENFYKTIEFLNSEFVEGEDVFTRAKYTKDFELYPNQDVSTFDGSFRSSKAAFIGVLKRAQVLFADPDLLNNIEKVIEKSTHECLKNPISSGEMLRALTYPQRAYKVIKLPKAWLINKDFSSFMKFFLPRFVFDYQEKEGDDSWQICGLESCELLGEGMESFMQTLTANQESH